MKKTSLYFVLWFILADIANYTDNKIILTISCVVGFFVIIYIIKKHSKNE